MHVDPTVVQPTTESSLMALGELGSAVYINAPFGQTNAFATDQSNHHPNQSLEMALVCPFARLTQQVA